MIKLTFLISLVLLAQLASAEQCTPDNGCYNLKAALQVALEKNFDIRSALERVNQAEGVIGEAKSKFAPRLDLASNYSRTDKQKLEKLNGNTFGGRDDWKAEIQLSQNVYRGGADSAQLKSSDLRKLAALDDLNSIRNSVIAETTSRFYAVLLAQEKVRVQEQNVQLLDEELKNEKSKLAAGTVSDFNVLRAEVELANARTPLIRSRNEARISREELARVMGIRDGDHSIGNDITVSGKLESELAKVSLQDALDTSRSERPELKKLKALLESASQQVKAERSAYMPELELYGLYGIQKQAFTSDINDELHGWQFGVRSNWNIFNGFATSSRVAQAQALESQARLELQQSQSEIEVEVRRALSSLDEARELVKSSKEVVRQATESLRLARARLDAGAGTQLEVLDTQVALTSARTNEVEAYYSYHVAWSSLQKAMGTIKAQVD